MRGYGNRPRGRRSFWSTAVARAAGRCSSFWERSAYCRRPAGSAFPGNIGESSRCRPAWSDCCERRPPDSGLCAGDRRISDRPEDRIWSFAMMFQKANVPKDAVRSLSGIRRRVTAKEKPAGYRLHRRRFFAQGNAPGRRRRHSAGKASFDARCRQARGIDMLQIGRSFRFAGGRAGRPADVDGRSRSGLAAGDSVADEHQVRRRATRSRPKPGCWPATL